MADQSDCTHVIDYSAEDFAERVLNITAGEGVPAVSDAVGGDMIARRTTGATVVTFAP